MEKAENHFSRGWHSISTRHLAQHCTQLCTCASRGHHPWQSVSNCCVLRYDSRFITYIWGGRGIHVPHLERTPVETVHLNHFYTFAPTLSHLKNQLSAARTQSSLLPSQADPGLNLSRCLSLSSSSVSFSSFWLQCHWLDSNHCKTSQHQCRVLKKPSVLGNADKELSVGPDRPASSLWLHNRRGNIQVPRRGAGRTPANSAPLPPTSSQGGVLCKECPICLKGPFLFLFLFSTMTFFRCQVVGTKDK